MKRRDYPLAYYARKNPLCQFAFERLPRFINPHRATGEGSFTVKASCAPMLKLETTNDGPAAMGWMTTLLVPADCSPELVPALEEATQP